MSAPVSARASWADRRPQPGIDSAWASSSSYGASSSSITPVSWPMSAFSRSIRCSMAASSAACAGVKNSAPSSASSRRGILARARLRASCASACLHHYRGHLPAPQPVRQRQHLPPSRAEAAGLVRPRAGLLSDGTRIVATMPALPMSIRLIASRSRPIRRSSWSRPAGRVSPGLLWPACPIRARTCPVVPGGCTTCTSPSTLRGHERALMDAMIVRAGHRLPAAQRLGAGRETSAPLLPCGRVPARGCGGGSPASHHPLRDAFGGARPAARRARPAGPAQRRQE
jgi:hypothetical protein